MNIYVYKKGFFKEPNEVKKAIIEGVKCLYSRICAYENQNIYFNNIYNDDSVKYDKHGDFYTFKTQKLNMQLRILYSYTIINGVPTIIIADYVVKKKNNKSYISKFDAVNHDSISTVLENSKLACSISC
jgi:hypothetical protein